jgi:hypothetical protein
VIHVLAQPALADAGQVGDLPLSHAVPAQDLDHNAKITMAAGIQHVRACADTLDNFAQLRDTYGHGVLPVPLGARP